MKTLTWPVSAPQAQVDTFAARKRGAQEREVCHLITPRMKFCAKPRPEVACQGDAGGKRQPPQDSAGGGVRTQVWAEVECSEISLSLNQKIVTRFKDGAVTWVCLCSLPSDILSEGWNQDLHISCSLQHLAEG